MIQTHNSTNVYKTHYCDQRMIFFVSFLSSQSRTYAYTNVDENTFDAFQKATSKGQFISKFIKPLDFMLYDEPIETAIKANPLPVMSSSDDVPTWSQIAKALVSPIAF